MHLFYSFQKSVPSATFSTARDGDNRNFSTGYSAQGQKPIRILKRPTLSSQTPVNNDFTNSTTISSTNHAYSPFPDDTSASTTVSFTPIAPRLSSREPTKPAIKTYEQREQEYRLARLRYTIVRIFSSFSTLPFSLRIMGEEESATKDDDDDNLPLESNTTSSLESNSKTGNTLDSSCQQPCHGANPVSSS